MPTSETCPVCGVRCFIKFLNLGSSPAANNLASNGDASIGLPRFPLALKYCDNCLYAKLSETVNPKYLFTNYSYLTGISDETVSHFNELFNRVVKSGVLRDTHARVVDVGSNDGTLLRFFKTNGFEVIGVEPSKNVSEKANGNGIPTINSFFDVGTLRFIKRKFGSVDLVTMTNVLTHVEHPNEMIKNAKSVINENGVIVAEFYYFRKIMENLAFDQIYHEHVSYFMFRNFCAMTKSIGLDVFDVQFTESQGGSLRVWLCKTGKREIKGSVGAFFDQEGSREEILAKYLVFSENVYILIEKIKAFVNKTKKSGKSIAGYGASAKATTLVNVCSLDSSSIDFVVDANVLKQGRFIPGTNIPVCDFELFNVKKPEIIIIFAWNIWKELLSNLKTNLQYSPEFYILVPSIRSIK